MAQKPEVSVSKNIDFTAAFAPNHPMSAIAKMLGIAICQTCFLNHAVRFSSWHFFWLASFRLFFSSLEKEVYLDLSSSLINSFISAARLL